MKDWQFRTITIVIAALIFITIPAAFFVGVAMATSTPTPPGQFGSPSMGEGYSEALDGLPPSVVRWTLDADYRIGRMAGARDRGLSR